MSRPIVFGIYGDSKQGKTTLITALVEKLANESYQVATIKQTNKAISIDTKNKDTWRHHHAGAHLVIFSSRCETNFLLDKHLSTSEIIQRISAFGNFDLILIEGADNPDITKIQVGTGKKRINTITVYKDNVQEILSLIKRKLIMNSLSPNISVTVNGKKISLTEFPAHIISNTIIGMLNSLKDVQNINEVTIELKP